MNDKKMKGDVESIEEFVCKYVHPGIGCGAPEMFVLGLLFLFDALVCAYLLFQHIRSRLKAKPSGFDFNILFWITMIIWAIYRFIIVTFHFQWNAKSWYLCGVCIDSILLLLPFSFMVIIISEMLFTYRNPGTQKLIFSRIVFVLFLTIFLVLGVLLSLMDVESVFDSGDTMMLWHGAVSIMIAVFIAMPSVRLVQAVSYPVVQPEDVSCVKWSKIGLWTIVFLFVIRSIHNFLTYIGCNPWNHWLMRTIEAAEDPMNLGTPVRAYHFLFDFIFNYVCAGIGIGGVYLLRKHDLDFADDSFYAPEKSETTSAYR